MMSIYDGAVNCSFEQWYCKFLADAEDGILGRWNLEEENAVLMNIRDTAALGNTKTLEFASKIQRFLLRLQMAFDEH